MVVDRNRFIASVANTFELLEVFSTHPGPQSLTALAATAGRPKSSVHRALSTLVEVGFIEQDRETHLYRLTLKMWRIGMSALAELDVVKVADEPLRDLMLAAGETVSLSMPEPSGSIVYVSKVEGPRPMPVRTQLGKLTPSWSTATGRAILAFRPELAERVLQRPLKGQTPSMVTDPGRIRALLEDVSRTGFAVTRGENFPELGGIAAPIRDSTGLVIASCAVAIPIVDMDDETITKCVPLVLATARLISKRLGHMPRDAD